MDRGPRLSALLSLFRCGVTDPKPALYASCIHQRQGHKGLVKPFKPGPPGIKLKGGDLEKLRKGEAVKQQLSAGSGGRGLVIQVRFTSQATRQVKRDCRLVGGPSHDVRASFASFLWPVDPQL